MLMMRLGSLWTASQKDLGANDADDAWLDSLWTAFQKDLGLDQMMLMIRGLAHV